MNDRTRALESYRYQDPAKVLERDEARTEFDLMDHRLKKWALWSRVGGIRPDLWESDPGPSGIVLTRDEVWDADKINILVLRLPTLHRLVLHVHYILCRDIECEPWQEVNRRLAKLARATFEQVPLIGRQEYRPIRDRAIRMLINAEEVLTTAIKRA